MADKELVWMDGEVKTPPFSDAARIEVGYYLRIVQGGGLLSMPISRPLPTIGSGCHELRVRDTEHNWRIMYHIGARHIVVLAVLAKKTQTTPDEVIKNSRQMLKQYNDRED